MSATIAQKRRGLPVWAAEEIVIVPGNDERRAIYEVKPIPGHRRRNLRENPALEITELRPRDAIVVGPIGKRRPETT
jgi:hypothetical protein